MMRRFLGKVAALALILMALGATANAASTTAGRAPGRGRPRHRVRAARLPRRCLQDSPAPKYCI